MKNSPEILIVEDDENLRQVIEFIVARSGFSVSVAGDGRAACARVGQGPAPDLVVLDVMLPYRDGFEVVRAVRADPQWHDVPILMLSARAQEQDVVRGLDCGANDYVVKPFRPQELVARIKRLLKTAA